MSATYTKLRDGSWGIRSTETIRVGQTVLVAKRDGSTKSETVGAIVWTGNGVTLASIGARSQTSSRGYQRRSGAGETANVYGYSSYCTGRMSCRCFDCE